MAAERRFPPFACRRSVDENRDPQLTLTFRRGNRSSCPLSDIAARIEQRRGDGAAVIARADAGEPMEGRGHLGVLAKSERATKLCVLASTPDGSLVSSARFAAFT